VLIELSITTSVMQLREAIVIPFRMFLLFFMQCLFIGKMLWLDFEIHMLNLCSEIGIHIHIIYFQAEEREEIPPHERWDELHMNSTLVF